MISSLVFHCNHVLNLNLIPIPRYQILSVIYQNLKRSCDLTVRSRLWTLCCLPHFIQKLGHCIEKASYQNHLLATNTEKVNNNNNRMLVSDRMFVITVASSCRSASTAFSRLTTNSSTYWYRNFLRARHSRAFCRLSSMRFAASTFSGLRPRFLPLRGWTVYTIWQMHHFSSAHNISYNFDIFHKLHFKNTQYSHQVKYTFS